MTELQSPLPSKPTTKLAGFGRIYMPNPGSRLFALRDKQPRRSAMSWKTKTWRMGMRRDPDGVRRQMRFQSQGNTSHCVRYGNTHLLMLEPIVRPDAFITTADLYTWAQRNDPWPGEEPSYYGTAVDAGLQYLLKVAKVIGEYRWPRNMDEVLTRLTLSTREGGGPLVVGTDFYSGMDGSGAYGTRNKWTPDGDLWGGHCYNLTGTLAPTAKRTRQITTGNSHDGNFEGVMDADAMEWLIFGQNGEAAAVTELAA